MVVKGLKWHILLILLYLRDNENQYIISEQFKKK